MELQMSNNSLSGIKVAILVADGFEQVELTDPRQALGQTGAETMIVSPKDDSVRAWKFKEWGRDDLGRSATGARPSLQTDLRNAGADWIDEEVVVDRNLITSRKPDDLPAFNREIAKLFEAAKSRKA
jgi:putative intracellular protease/amidase